MKVIPLKAIPSQKLNIVLGNQNCTITIYQRGEYLYCNLSVDNVTIRNGMICLVDTNLLAYPVNGFSGLLWFSDLTGMGGTPYYAQLGSRYVMYYDEVPENV